MRAPWWVILSCIVLSAACKPRVEDVASAVKKAGGPDDNRSAEGGLKGTSDGSDDSSGQPQFRIKGDYPDSPAFVTSPPPEPDMTRMRGRDAAIAKAAALEWAAAIQTYAYEDMNDQ